MGRHEIVSPDSLRVLSGHVARMQQEIHNLRRRLAGYRCELDDVEPKRLFRFILDSALATSDPTGTGLITHQYGVGVSHSTTGTVTLINLLTATADTYLFEGTSGAAGLAYYGTSTGSPIIQMECP